ncbi:MAG TPA: STAS domain-containing protein [Candidatus Nitrosotalea sp.]|nr:STAS domain-containing protein [Candidatus Nitrosotalea sp.]
MAKDRHLNRVALDGEWDFSRKDELAALLGTLERDGAATIDIKGVSYADSTLLSVLAALRMKFAEVPITLLGPQPQIRRLLKLVQFDKLFNVVDD